MTFYDLALFVHISSVIIWLGTAFCLHVLGRLAEREGDARSVQTLLGHGKALSNRVFAPSSGLAVLAGIALVIDGPWGFGDLWVLIGIAAIVASTILITLFGKAQERAAALAERDGPLSEEAFEAARRFLMLGRIDLALLFVVVAAMSLKPTADDAGVVAVLAAALIAASIWSIRVARRPAAGLSVSGDPAMPSGS